MKKTVRIVVCTFVLTVIAALAAIGVSASNRVTSIDVQVELKEDGSAYIVQTWTGSFDEGTECYIPFSTNGYLTIGGLSVSCGNTVYESLEKWDVDRSFEEKAYKCGLHETSSGYEICWGISDYGNNVYTLQYRVGNVVRAFNDADGFNFRFINDQMNTTPTNGSVTFTLWNGEDITDEICNIWAFGYNGQIVFEDGKVRAYTESPLNSDSSMTIMLEFQKGIFSPLIAIDDSFESVKNTAFEGSDYDTDGDDPTIFYVILIIIGIVTGIIIILAVIKIVNFRKFVKNAPYYRENPNGGKLDMTYVLGCSFKICAESSVIGARILRLINSGAVSPSQQEDVGLFGRRKKVTELYLIRIPEMGDKIDSLDIELYHLLEKAAGSDRILQEKELEKLCDRSPSLLRRFIDACANDGNVDISLRRCYKRASYGSLDALTDAGKNELSQIFGLKKYLLEYSLIAERSLNESALWQDYMTYATLFGIADKVAQQLKKVYPQYVPQIETYEECTVYACRYSNIMYSAMRQREMEIEAKRAKGSGGLSSFGGGGGFSGGGSGGGTR